MNVLRRSFRTMAYPSLDPSVLPTIHSRIALQAKDGPVSVPLMATGTWAWGDKSIWDYKPDDFKAIKQAFLAALETQGGLFDTAEVYGNGESEVCG